MRERIHKLEEAIRYMINHDCSLEDFAKILLECGMDQGKIEEIVTRINNNRNTNLKK